MTGILTTISGADYSADNIGVVGPYTSVALEGLFDLRISHDRSRHNHATTGARPCLLNRANPPTFAAGHVETDTVGQIYFPEGPLHNNDNTMFGVFELHRAGGAIPQSPFGLSISTGPNLRGQFLLGNGPGFLRAYTYVRPEPDNFASVGTQKNVSYTIPTDGSLDNEMVFAAAVIRNGAGLDLYLPGVDDTAPVGTTALAATDLVFFGSSAAEENIYDLRYRSMAFAGDAQKVRAFGYAHRALSLTEINQIHADLAAYYAGHGLTFV